MFGAAVGGSALNLLIGNLSADHGTTDMKNEHQRKDALHDYQEMEQKGIISRVAGAKAAGLHPLAALGFQAGPSPTMSVGGGDMPPIQTNFGKDPNDPNDAFRNAQIRLMHAQADEAESRARASYTALATQPGNAPPTASLPTEDANLRANGQGQVLNGIKVVPNEIQASANGKTIGVHPGQTDINDPMLGRVTGMSEQMLKQTEDMELLRTAYFIAANKDRLIQFVVDKLKSLDFRKPSDREAAREYESLKKRFPPKGQPAKWPPRMHGGYVTEERR